MNENNNSTQDPAVIERDIRRTQEDMSRTVDKIGDQMTIRNVFNALLDKADQNDVDARYLIDGARRNPIALGLIAAGAIWLVSDKDSKFPGGSKSSNKSRFGSSDDSESWEDADTAHRDYVAYMSTVEWQDGEDELAYQRRRDVARANFLMVERNPDEDESSFRQRLDSMSEKFREKRRAWSDSASQAASSIGSTTSDTARWATDKAQDTFYSNPLVGGILAAAVGAAFGGALPISRREQEKLGSVGHKARDMASEQKDQIASKLHEKKDEVLQKADEKIKQADEKIKPSGSDQQSGTGDNFSQSGGTTQSSTDFGGTRPSRTEFSGT